MPPGVTLRGPGYPGDFDGDGDLDLLVEMERDLRGRAPSGSVVQRRIDAMALLANDGQGALAFARQASDDGVTFAVDALEARASLVEDVDGDGDLDLVTRALAPTAQAPVLSRLWINGGAGAFAEASLPEHRRAELLVDLDLDGLSDLVVGKYPLVNGFPELKVLRGASSSSGALEFVEQPMISVRLVGNVVAGDLHSRTPFGGGYPDLLFVAKGLFAGWASISGGIALNGFDPEDGGWGFAVMNAASLVSTSRASVGDIDLDGRDDYMLGAYGTEVDRCTLGLKRGAGWWEHVVASQLLPDGLLVDVDGDGDLDVLGERIVINTTLP